MKVLVLLLSYLLCGVTCAVQAQSSIVAVTEELPPYSYTENKKLTGYAVQIAEAVLKQAGLEYKLTSYPWARAYMLATTNPNVLIFTLARTAEREKEFHWIGSLGPRRLYLFKLASRKDLNLKNLGDAKSYLIGVDRNDASEQFLTQQGFVVDRNLDRSPDEIANIQKLLIGRIDFVAGSDQTVQELLKRLAVPASKLERSIMIVDQGEYFLAMSKATPLQNVERLKKAYLEVQRTGLISELRTKYGLPND